jgi:hypothetical protein
MEKLNRGDKIYLDKEKTRESAVNHFLKCRDGIIKVYEYRDESGYGSKTRLFLCEDTKHEAISIIRQVYVDYKDEWIEESVDFDSDSYIFLRALINGNENEIGGKYYLVRYY